MRRYILLKAPGVQELLSSVVSNTYRFETTLSLAGRLSNMLMNQFARSLSVLWICLPIMVSSMTRKYYITAVIREWDYAPSGNNQIKGIPLQDDR